MKGQMKKLPGYWPLSLDMPLKLSQTFTKPIPLNLGLCHSLSLDVFTHSKFQNKFTQKKIYYLRKSFFIFKALCSFFIPPLLQTPTFLTLLRLTLTPSLPLTS